MTNKLLILVAIFAANAAIACEKCAIKRSVLEAAKKKILKAAGKSHHVISKDLKGTDGYHLLFTIQEPDSITEDTDINIIATESNMDQNNNELGTTWTIECPTDANFGLIYRPEEKLASDYEKRIHTQSDYDYNAFVIEDTLAK